MEIYALWLLLAFAGCMILGQCVDKYTQEVIIGFIFYAVGFICLLISIFLSFAVILT